MVSLLQRAKNATVIEIMKTSGWQLRTVRAALTGLRKKGMIVECTDTGIYRIGYLPHRVGSHDAAAP